MKMSELREARQLSGGLLSFSIRIGSKSSGGATQSRLVTKRTVREAVKRLAGKHDRGQRQCDEVPRRAESSGLRC